MTPEAIRLRLLEAGFMPLPVNGKVPVVKAWQTLRDLTAEQIRLWSRTCSAALSTGVLTRLTPTLDVDITDPEAVEAIESLVKDRFEESGYVLPRIGRSPKRCFPFRTLAPFPKIVANLTAPNGAQEKLELLAEGQQFVAHGIHPDTGKPYSWPRGEPGAIKVDASHERMTMVVQLHRIDSVYLRDILCRSARWRRWDGKKQVAVDAPENVARTILARAGEWGFPSIAGVISTPTMRPDGTILIREGFDPATRLLLVAPPVMPTIAERPTRGDAMTALATIKDLLVEFPFVGAVDRAVALSAIITPVVRGAFPVAPMHSAKAPVAGSGKSYLFDVAAAVAIGQIMPVMAAGSSEEELRSALARR
jgi:Bifunctional DNA primase/polymerase, N-terminal